MQKFIGGINNKIIKMFCFLFFLSPRLDFLEHPRTQKANCTRPEGARFPDGKKRQRRKKRSTDRLEGMRLQRKWVKTTLPEWQKALRLPMPYFELLFNSYKSLHSSRIFAKRRDVSWLFAVSN